MRANSRRPTERAADAVVEGEVTPYQLTLAALTYSWGRQAAFDIAIGLAFALVGGALLGLAWTLGLCALDWVLQQIYPRLAARAAGVRSDRGMTWLSWLVFAKGALWYAIPTGFTVLNHSAVGLAYVAVQAVGLTALAVSTARHSRRVFLTMVAVPVAALPLCVVATLGVGQGAGVLCETLVLAFALWLIGSGTSRVVSEWNQSQAERLQAMAEMRAALKRSEIAEARLSEALGRAEAANRAKSEFLATMSHEIRTPLNSVLGMAQAMHRGELSEPQRGHLRMISTAGESLLSLLNDLLDLSKADAGKIELEDGVIDTEALAAGVEAFTPLLQDKDVVLSVAVAPEAAGGWSGDPTRVRQVLHNLISNAVKFTDRGTISVTISHDGAGLVLAVEDTGMGISASRLDQVFEPFVQADASTTRRYGGSGLGLTICRDLVALMGGTIDLVSTEGVGSRFIVTLPARAVAQPAAAAEAQAPIIAVDGLRVLAAEDNPMNQVVLRTLLEAADICPVVVSNGEEAVAAWRPGAWDVVLMDVQMPVMDGVAATQAIRQAERDAGAARTPIIALTANAMDHHRSEYLGAGMDAVVAKPINLTVLLNTIQALIAPAADQVPPSETLAPDRRLAHASR
ncbi:MAG TPA: ATP-binding protein [Phenylobacterium sp.]|jgi:signal transduction histidine kinase/FixJ family two-component response regulator|uniref:ATP-binding protein n=1 Tax=Phenylobacterium sp. TaxID=1871053 RepID=UPI002C2B6ABF|nr:ATP-binding protein [Phenylobacterium sp.]HXA38691.1 ATP-binding protein [Phenylobacterium sp.]